jgi:hypothetical protein
MKIYLADSSVRHFALAEQGCLSRGIPLKIRRILLSYHYVQNTPLDSLLEKHFVEPYPEVFLDSGAFSAFSQGAKVDIVAYCNYISQYKHLLTVYSNLDVIGSAEGTFANQKHMEKRGLEPLPVFHVGEDWKYLKTYLEYRPYIALGGMVPYNSSGRSKKIIPWLVQCFKRAKNISVYHGFGCTSWDLIMNFPWYSVDSSTWSQAYRWGKPLLFDKNMGRFFEVRLGDYRKCYRYASLFRSLGFDPIDFSDREKNKKVDVCAIAALSFVQAEQWLERRHGPITIPERNETSA